jgi:hypothetical protein
LEFFPYISRSCVCVCVRWKTLFFSRKKKTFQ